jgi:transposase
MRIVGVTGGVDTHADTHVAAAIDDNGGRLGVESFPATESGFEDLLGWLVGFGPVERIGVEGTGSWGVGLARYLTGHDVMVVEVDRPNRQTRRKQGKSDPTDAVSAARAAPSGTATVTPRVETVRWRRCVFSWWLDVRPVNNASNPSTSCDVFPGRILH